MDSKQSKVLGYLLLLCCILPLLLLGLHLWTYNYQVGGGAPVRGAPGPSQALILPSAPVARRLRASLRLDSARFALRELAEAGRALAAELLLANPGPDAARVLDADAPELVEARLFYLGADGRAAPRLLTPAEKPLRAGGGDHQVLVLLPGRKLALPVPLLPAFPIQAPGRYRLEAAYVPGAFAASRLLNLPALGVSAEREEALGVEFEVY